MQPIATVGGAAVDPDGPLLAFAARLRRQHARAALFAAALRTLLIAAVPAILAAWWWPGLRPHLGLSLVVLVTFAALRASLRAHRVADAGLLGADEPGAAASGAGLVGDELATWLEHRQQPRADAPMVGWLGRDVAARLPALPATAVAGAGRRGLGRLRRLVPVVIVLLLCWFVAEWLRPPWPGALGGGAGSSGPAGGGGSGDGAGGGASTDPSAAPRPPEQPQQSPGEQPPPPPALPPAPAEEEPPATTPEQPAPLLELPEQQRFVVPEFVGDGPTRRARMFAAEVERGGGAPPPPPSGGAGAADPALAAPSARETFARAAEAAQRARHVPPDEQPMVRRFFRVLQEQAK